MRTIYQKSLPILIPLILASCSHTLHGLEVVSPPVDYISPWLVEKVDSLHPTLAWKGTTSDVESYDLIVYSGVYILRSGVTPHYERGVKVYYREGIMGTSHQIEESLEPDTVYLWSVRTRMGSNLGDWSTYDFTRFMDPPVTMTNQWWRFRTPKK